MTAPDLIQVQENNFDAEVLASPVPVLVDCVAPWCGTCRLLAPVVKSIALTVAPHVKIVTLDAEESPQRAETLGVRGLPTFVLFSQRQEVSRLAGPQTRQSLLDALAPWMPAADTDNNALHA